MALEEQLLEQADMEFNLEFRSMQLNDVEHICRIEEEAFSTPWTAAAYINELKNNHFARYMVMELEGEIIGYAGMWLIMEEAHVTNLAVRADYRGKKLGERLVRELQKTARFIGAVRMTLEVRKSNIVAQSLYRKLGFYSVGFRKGYYSDGEDAMIMWVDLPQLTYSEEQEEMVR